MKHTVLAPRSLNAEKTLPNLTPLDQMKRGHTKVTSTALKVKLQHQINHQASRPRTVSNVIAAHEPGYTLPVQRQRQKSKAK